MRVIQHFNCFGSCTPNLKLKLQWYKYDRPYTMVIDLDNYKFWKDVIRQTEPIELDQLEFEISVGLAIVNPIDQFDRKMGLKKALETMKTYTISLSKISYLAGGDIELGFTLFNIDLVIVLGHSNNRAIISGYHGSYILDLHHNLSGR